MNPRFFGHLLIALAVLSVFVPTVAQAQEREKGPAAATDDRETSDFVSPETARLELFIGPWNVLETHFNPKGEVVATTTGTEEIAWILGRRVIRRSYTTGSSPSTYQAIGMLGWNQASKKYRGAWFDSVATSGPTLVSGEWVDGEQTMVFQMEAMGSDGTAMRFRVVEEFVDSDHRVATTYLLKGNEVIKQMVVRYERTMPCPDRLRAIFDDLPAKARPGKGDNK